MSYVMTALLRLCYVPLLFGAMVLLLWRALCIRLLPITLLLMLPSVAHAASLCTHYASPQGSGSSCTQSAPCQVQSFWAHAGPGKTLCMLDGNYSGESSMLLPPQNVSGSASQPLTIRALNDGKVTLNGNGYFALLLGNQDGSGNAYMVIEGINAHHGGEALYRVRGSHNTLRRVIGWDGTHGQADSNIIRITGHNNWCEDCAGWGINSRKIMDMAQGNNVGGGGFLRAWGEWNDHPQGSANPNNTFLISYNTGNARFLNVLGTWNGLGQVGNAEGVMEIARECDGNLNAEGTLVKGALMYVLPGATVQTNKLVNGFCASGFTLEDVAAVASGQAHVRPFVFEKGSSVQPSGSVCKNCLGVHAGSPSTNSSNSGWSTPGFREGNSLAQATGGTSAFTLLGGLCKRYTRDGTLTSEPLWPWPMNQRILEARQQSGYTPVDVTEEVQKMLGPIPTSCRQDGVPSTDTTPPQVTLTAPSHQTLVSGTAGLTATATDNLAVVGVQFALDGTPIGAEPCCNQPMPTVQASTQVDTTPWENGVYTLTAIARDAAGNTATSEPVTILAFNGAPQPPRPPAAPLACTGELKEKGRIDLVCNPQPARR